MAVKKSSTKKKSASNKKAAPRRTSGSKSKPVESADNNSQQQTKRRTASKQQEQAKSKPQQQKKTQQRDSREERDNIASSEAFRIIEQAASILEEEISAGIVAAKKVEERYVDINSLRTGAPEHVMQRFRKDAHEVLDILLDMVNLSVSALGGLGKRAMSIRGASSGVGSEQAEPGRENLPELLINKVLKPGESGRVSMLIENDEENDSEAFSLSCSGLLNNSGEQLDPSYISFEPASLQVAAKDIEKVVIHVSIPESATDGVYSGLLNAPELQIRAILTVRVESE